MLVCGGKIDQLRESEIGAIVNRELKQRIRSVSGLTMHRPVARQDIRHATRVIQALDSRWNLWSNPDDEKKDQEKEVTILIEQYYVMNF